MLSTTAEQRRALEQMTADELAEYQLVKFNDLLSAIIPHNPFYSKKLSGRDKQIESLAELADLPFTTKGELVAGTPGTDYASNTTFPTERYVRFHRTSGTRGRPLVVLDTQDDWNWWINAWQFVYDAAEVGPEDRVFMAFSFGPFIGFWSANDAAIARGALTIPGGGISTVGRLELIQSSKATTVLCTPSYAMHMADVAAENGIDVASFETRRIIVAGEPGGSIPAIRSRIENAWNARVIDHSGATEVGPWGYADPLTKGLHVIESEFIAEFLSVDTGQPASEGELSELVLTTLGRVGSPVIRYRTGDLVKPSWDSETSNRFVLLEGGVLGRADDMMIIRGVNVFPSSVEQILRSFPEIVEYRMTAFRNGEMDALRVEIEDRLADPKRVEKELRIRLGLRVEVQSVAMGTLPRYEAKGKRFIDQR